ncbi:MAG: caspase family protein [Bernardetiaceae bacterium]|nr:caspase family protein [Bernardetiaceae bacterium]
MGLIDKKNTQILLIGVSEYQDEELHSLPAAVRNLDVLEDIFVSDTIGAAQENVRTLKNPKTAQEVLQAIHEAAKQARKSLVIYYAGHGVLDQDFNLFLTAEQSAVETIIFSGIPLEQINKLIRNERLSVIFILDCCFSERAFETFRKTNYYVMASSKRNVPSKYPEEELFSAFTQEFIHVLEQGADLRKNHLTLRDIYLQIKRNLLDKGFPEPRQINTNVVQEEIFAQNKFDQLITATELNKRIITPVFFALQQYRDLPDVIEAGNDLGFTGEWTSYFEDEDPNYGESLQVTERANQIIRYSPPPLAESLKRLFAPSLQAKADNTFRLRHILECYFSLSQFTAYVLLAQLWDECARVQNIKLPDDFSAVFARFDTPKPSDFIRIVRSITQFFAQQGINPYVSELSTWSQNLMGSTALAQAIDFLEDVASVKWNEKTNDEIKKSCYDAERALTVLLEASAFWAAYEMASIRNILLFKAKNTEPKFLHLLNHIRNDANDSANLKTEENTFYTDSHAVLLLKQTELRKEDFLNLSPLIIDRNAFTRSTIPSLYWYEKKQETAEGYLYKPVNGLGLKSEPLASKHGEMRWAEQFENFLRALRKN